MARHIQTEITIDAPPNQVWKHLTDWPRFPEWNPFIRKIEGQLDEGSRLNITVEPAGGKAMDFSPKLLTVSENRELKWLGRVALPGIFDGEHSFLLEPESGGTKFVQAERFSGPHIPLMWNSFGPGTIEGFRMMNEALKERAEAG